MLTSKLHKTRMTLVSCINYVSKVSRYSAQSSQVQCSSLIEKELTFYTFREGKMLFHFLLLNEFQSWCSCMQRFCRNLSPCCNLRSQNLCERSWHWETCTHDEYWPIVSFPTSCVAEHAAHLRLAQLTDGFPNSASAKAIKWSAGVKWLYRCWGAAIGSEIPACYCLRPLWLS